jgi:branched-chain amino acid transport system substrate-binding protein
MKKLATQFSLMTLVLLSLTQFTLAEDPKSAPLRLGMISPLTGDYAVYGQHIKRGVELAQEDLASKGVETEIYYEDACLPAQAVGAINKLTSLNKIDALVGSYCVVGMIPSVSILEKARVIAFHTSVVPQEMLDSGQYVFSTNARIGDEATKLAEYAFNELSARKAAILYLTTQWGEEYQQYFVKRFTELGGAIIDIETSLIGVNDFRSELTRIKSRNPDVVFLAHVGVNLANALKQASQLGFKTPFVTVNEAEEQEVIASAKNYAEGIKFFAPEPITETEEMKKFDTEFRQRFNRDTHPLSRHAYDATMLAGSVLAACRHDYECADKKLYAIKDYSGATGKFSIQTDGGTMREFVLKTIKDGHFVKVAR